MIFIREKLPSSLTALSQHSGNPDASGFLFDRNAVILAPPEYHIRDQR